MAARIATLDVEVTMTQGNGKVSAPFILRGLTPNEALMVSEDVANYASVRIVSEVA